MSPALLIPVATIRAVPITSSNIQGLRGLSWTPDGDIIYSARKPEYIDIFRLSGNGRDFKQLTGGPDDKAEAAMTRDRRYVLYQSRGQSLANGCRW